MMLSGKRSGFAIFKLRSCSSLVKNRSFCSQNQDSFSDYHQTPAPAPHNSNNGGSCTKAQPHGQKTSFPSSPQKRISPDLRLNHQGRSFSSNGCNIDAHKEYQLRYVVEQFVQLFLKKNSPPSIKKGDELVLDLNSKWTSRVELMCGDYYASDDGECHYLDLKSFVNNAKPISIPKGPLYLDGNGVFQIKFDQTANLADLQMQSNICPPSLLRRDDATTPQQAELAVVPCKQHVDSLPKDEQEKVLKSEATDIKYNDLKEEMGRYAENDLAAVEATKSTIEVTQAAANRLTDDIFIAKQQCSNNLPATKDQIDSFHKEGICSL